MSVKRIAIFGSTGSIGTQCLEVIAANPELFSAEILTAQNNDELLIQQALTFNPNLVVIGDEKKYQKVKDALVHTSVKVFAGEAAIEEAAGMDCYDMMLAAIVGYAGLKPTLKAIENGKPIALANKETLVVAGEIVMQKAVETGFAQKTATGYRNGAGMTATSLFLMVDDKNFILASDSATYAAYIAGTGKATISADVLSKLKGKSTASFVDFTSLFTAAIAGVNDESGKKALTAANNTFKNVIVTSDNFEDKSVKSYFEVNMVNAKQNSLVSTANFINDLIAIFKEEEAKRKAMYSTEYEILKDVGIVPEK